MTRRVLVTGGSGFIGTNAVRHHAGAGAEVLNLDRAEPQDPDAPGTWTEVDLLDARAVASAVADFGPTEVLHLAARTDLDGATVADYAVNVEGTANLLDALDPATCRKVVVASSMLAGRPGDPDAAPTTPYGESKRDMERLVRARTGGPPWVLARLTSVWGPWFGEPYRPFVERVLRHRYVHPGSTPVTKAYAYVGNVLHQLDALPADGRTLYVSDDPPYSTHDWAAAIAAAAGVPAPRSVPVGVMKVAAKAGDLLARTGIWRYPPMTSFRLANMRQPASFDTTEVRALAGPSPYDLDAAVAETVAWLRR